MQLAREVKSANLADLPPTVDGTLKLLAPPKDEPATNLFGEPDARMEENGDGWRDRLLPEQLSPADLLEIGRGDLLGAEQTGLAAAPAREPEAPNRQAEASEPKAAGEVLDDPLSEARKRYSSAQSRAFRDNDANSARYALKLLREEIRPALERVARDGIEIDRSRWQR